MGGEIAFSGFMLFVALFFVALNGVFVLAEFAFATIRGTQVDGLVNEGRASAGLVKEATRRLDAYLAVCQLGITISSLSLGALGEPAIARLIEPAFEAAGMPEAFVHPVAFAIGFLIITSLHVVLGELVPKSVGIQRPENSALFIAPLMKFFYYLFLPLMVVFNGAGNAIVKAFGIPPTSDVKENHTEEELRMIIAQLARRGSLRKSEEQMLEGVFELEDTTAREVMIPRPDVVSLAADMPLHELAPLASSGNHTRYPVHEEGAPDRVAGSIHVRDVFGKVLEVVEAGGSLEGAGVRAGNLMREVITVPENLRLDKMLEEFRRREAHLAVIVDEWGSFEGIVTIEDVLEEIVGDIRDEFDNEQTAPPAANGAESPSETLGFALAENSPDTVGRLAKSLLGRPPRVGDEIRLKGRAFLVESAVGGEVLQLAEREEQTGNWAAARHDGGRRIVVRILGAAPDDHRDAVEETRRLLREHPEAAVEILTDSPAISLLQTPSDDPNESFRDLLSKPGVCAAVCGDTLKVRLCRTILKLRKFTREDGRSVFVRHRIRRERSPI